MKDMLFNMRMDGDEYTFLFGKSKREGIPMSKLIRQAITALWPDFKCKDKIDNIVKNT